MNIELAKRKARPVFRVESSEIVSDFQWFGRTLRRRCHVSDIMRESTLALLYHDLNSYKSMAQRRASAASGSACPAATWKKV